MRKSSFICATLLLLVIASVCAAQKLGTRITDQDVIDMVALQLSDDLIIDKIHAAQETNFDTSVAGLRTLKAANVSEAVIRAMISAHPSRIEENPGFAAPQGANGALPSEIGVYVMIRGKLAEIEPEIVNWQTGGVIKNIVSLGVIKGDKNGKVMRGDSRTRLAGPLDFLIKTPEGTSVEEYQLLRLHKKNNRREFRSVTGGVLHVSGGAQRDEIAFQPEKIATRIWKVRLNGLRKGEYGFLPPGIESSSISASGKMFTFSVIEEDGTQPAWDLTANKEAIAVPVPTNETRQPSPVMTKGSIGASSDENPNVRHDGVTLSHVDPGGPADQAGIRSGDVVLAIDDQYLFTAGEFKEEISRRKPGTKIAFRYRRHSMIFDIYLVLGSAK